MDLNLIVPREVGLVIHTQGGDIKVLIQQGHGAAMQGSRLLRLHHPAPGIIDWHSIPQVSVKYADFLEGLMCMTEYEADLPGKEQASSGALFSNLFLQGKVYVIIQAIIGILAQDCTGLGPFPFNNPVYQAIDK
jgi:hypothetical protein